MFLVFTAFMLPIIVGFLVLAYFWPAPADARSSLFVGGCLAVGAGLGGSSLAFVVWLVIFGTSNRIFMITEISVLIAAMVFFLYLIHKKIRPYLPMVDALPITNRNWRLYLTWGFYAVVVTSIVVMSLMTVNRPHGGSDAWTIWNATARFLNGGCEKWTDSFSLFSPLAHADYPLLLPASIARIWGYTKYASPAVPALLAMVFTVTAVVLLVSALMQFQSELHGYLAGLAILALPGFIKVGAGQIADVPLGFYMLSTIVFFCLGDHSTGESWPYFVGAGLMAGLSAWTKNEGLLFIVAIILSRLVIIFPKHRKINLFKDISFFTAGLLPILLIVFYFKSQIAPPNDLLAGQGFEITMGRFVAPARHLAIAKAFVTEFYSFGKLRILIFPICLFLLGLSTEKKFRQTVRTGTLMLLLMLAGYYIIYLITPHDLVWHIQTSLQRLFIQLLPSAVFIFFLAINGSLNVGWVRKQQFSEVD
jgi:hypothetical protein